MDEYNNVFEFKEDINREGEEILQEAKRKSTARIMLISFGIMLGVVGLGVILKMQVNPLVLKRDIIDRSIYENVYGSNTYIGEWDDDYRLINPSSKAPKYKIVDGIVVLIGEVVEPSINSDRLEKIENAEGEVFATYGERVMQFYHPSVKYDTYPNALEKLDDIGEDKVVELGISLDKVYAYDEVQMMLPEGVTLQWGWVDSYDEPSDERIYVENEVVGIRSFDAWGKPIQNPVEATLNSLEAGMRNRGESREIFNSIHKKLEDRVAIIGIVVSGTPEELKALQQETYIKAATLGVVAERY